MKETHMTPEQARLITTSWSTVVSVADSAIAQFYNRLFEIDPSARALFRVTDMSEQRRKVIEALSLALQSLNDLKALTPTLEDLGRRHQRYGVTSAHYDSVGQALLWTLEQGLGNAWTPATAAAWTELYGQLSDVMKGASSAGPQHKAA
jgi:hemoglobin-like flavoprotein